MKLKFPELKTKFTDDELTPVVWFIMHEEDCNKSLDSFEEEEDEEVENENSSQYTGNFIVLPNPISGQLIISTTKGDIITVRDLLGNIVDEKESTDNLCEFDISKCSAGVYFVQSLT